MGRPRKGSGFGETSVSATAPDVDRVSAFAAERADHTLTIMLVNKQLHEAAPSDVSLGGVSAAGSVDTVTLSDGRVSQLPTQAYQNGALMMVLPPQSVTLLVVHPNAH